MRRSWQATRRPQVGSELTNAQTLSRRYLKTGQGRPCRPARTGLGQWRIHSSGGLVGARGFRGLGRDTGALTSSMTAAASSVRYRFGRFELQLDERRLLAAGVPVAVGLRAFNLLVALVERAGHLVTKDELFDRVWPKVIVQEAALYVQVSALRKILGSNAIAQSRVAAIALRGNSHAPAWSPPLPRQHHRTTCRSRWRASSVARRRSRSSRSIRDGRHGAQIRGHRPQTGTRIEHQFHAFDPAAHRAGSQTP